VEPIGNGKANQPRLEPWRPATDRAKSRCSQPMRPVSRPGPRLDRASTRCQRLPRVDKRCGRNDARSRSAGAEHPNGWLHCLLCRRDRSSPVAVSSVVLGLSGKKSPAESRFSPIRSNGGLAFLGRFAIIQVTHSPCLSRLAVTHIKGEFFYCAPSDFHREEPR
jgi:hypothetical protein